MIMSYLLDTNIVSLVIKQNVQILQKIETVKAKEQNMYISCISYFEIKRGLLAVKATTKLKIFNKFCQNHQIILLDDLAILEKAAEIHANLRLRGLPIQTEDILIAATAIIKGLTVVSNDSDLLRVEHLSLENWVEL
ncbi:plasmid maintenance protein [Aphanothece sacrum FPU1]|uniref:Plasmid maintenance protein n=2 Tax=Aphanothece sacrum TaxID=1122 RepID=A0A401IHR0_APHSA|nr:plasmid maintenance protein [Aphanothece sacrum FPU1]GBF83303.1 plasmid maintenance protein [Aphanothece sacrum FPU3]